MNEGFCEYYCAFVGKTLDVILRLLCDYALLFKSWILGAASSYAWLEKAAMLEDEKKPLPKRGNRKASLEFEYLFIHQESRALHVIKEEEKEVKDTFHDSGTSGHEPDSLEAIETLVSGSGSPPVDEGCSNGDASVLLHLERCAHRQTRRTLQELKEQHEALRQQISQNEISATRRDAICNGVDSFGIEAEARILSLESVNSMSPSDPLAKQLKIREKTILELRRRVATLEQERMKDIPLTASQEISRLNSELLELEKSRDELILQNFSLKSRLAEVATKIDDPAATYQVMKGPYEQGMAKILRKATYKVTGESWLREAYQEFNLKEEGYLHRIADLESQFKNDRNNDYVIRDLEAHLEDSQQKVEATNRFLLEQQEECSVLKLDLETVNGENKRLQERLNARQQEIASLMTDKDELHIEMTRLKDESRVLAEDCNRERVLRKKYYNQMEEMKGKIRVFCRVRPLNELERRKGGAEEVVKVEDEFSLSLETARCSKSFLFDRVFENAASQDTVFRDTNALIQSALDGYNVTIMAYGQTGSGKTYTMLGTADNPGIAPRSFERLFRLVEENSVRTSVVVHAHMFELYNDRLVDLLKPPGALEGDRLEIKRDKKGSVFVQGATTKEVSCTAELNRAFQLGLANRHTAQTKMNAESSRSHLLIVVGLAATCRQNGAVLRGKLTLVDLAGSERIQKSGSSAEQLRETNSINKSLSALGDVISALSTEAMFIPYRNSKLTMLLQDSLGGNAKTLIFVNVSPSSYNAEETLISLMYASRIKQITNNASKNLESKEISRLKAIISKLKKEENVDEDVS